ncbi:hypothetical protein K1719_006513 [Acacia pycnantha]|nr:hypothetical protein K1719_006513 [Acacia pycnantha]
MGRGANWLAECIVKQHDSPLWKNVARLWPEVTKGIGWEVRDGRSVKFWEDRWLNGADKLGNHYVGELGILNPTLTVFGISNVSAVERRCEYGARGHLEDENHKKDPGVVDFLYRDTVEVVYPHLNPG